MHSLPNLPASIAHEVFARLCGHLPEHPTDTPESLASRNDLAMAAVAALHPTDALDANIAVDIASVSPASTATTSPPRCAAAPRRPTRRSPR
jgi:hypothetical protein